MDKLLPMSQRILFAGGGAAMLGAAGAVIWLGVVTTPIWVGLSLAVALALALLLLIVAGRWLRAAITGHRPPSVEHVPGRGAM